MATKKAMKRRKMLIAGGIGGGVLVLAGLLMVFGPGSKQMLRGSITVIDTDFYYSSSVETNGSSCYTTGGYSDVNSGTNVAVKNGDGKLLGVTDLSSGVTVGSYRCKFSFELEVSKSDFYSFDIGNRDEVSYSKDELESKDWNLELSLGD
jgi:hypothetical protein